MRRVGHGDTVTDEQLAIDYDAIGALVRDAIVARVPGDWFRPDRRVLDFGSGAGRTLRHFGLEREVGVDFWGCDIDRTSIEWAAAHMPWMTFFTNDEAPPLSVPDEHFDLVYAMSVFTHITFDWADWLLEMHRVLRPGGLFVASFLGPSMFEMLLQEPYEESQVGMLVTRPGASWEAGGPIVFHSSWWIEAHWSPAFELLSVEDNPLIRENQTFSHGIAVGRRTAERPTREALVTPGNDPTREAAAAISNVWRLCREVEREA